MSFAELASRCRGRWVEVMSNLAPHEHLLAAIERGPRRSGYCPVHVGRNGDAFRVFRNFPDTGGAVCNTCGSFPNGFGVLRWLNGWEWRDIAARVEAYLDGGKVEPAASFRSVNFERASPSTGVSLERLRSIWNEALPLHHTDARPLRQYLGSRGVVDVDEPPLRLHPSLKYFDADRSVAGEYPVMLAAMVDAAGDLVALHRTYLSPEGSKAPVPSPKKLLKRRDAELAGGAIRLYEASGVLGLTEGIENALSVRIATGMPVWATYSSSVMRSVRLPQHVRKVVNWADRDVPRLMSDGTYRQVGRDEAEMLGARLRQQGIDYEVRMPAERVADEKRDWNDVLREQGVSAFSTSMRTHLPTARRLQAH